MRDRERVLFVSFSPIFFMTTLEIRYIFDRNGGMLTVSHDSFHFARR